MSRVDYTDSGAKKSAVETFTDMLAEVRKYGEGLIIADQIPGKLAPEVLKNTNMKIIHKLLARDDKEIVGDTMLMNEKQKEYLSALETGDAVIFSEYTESPVHVHVEKLRGEPEEPDGDTIRKYFGLLKKSLGISRELENLYPLFEHAAKNLVRKFSEDERKTLLEEVKNLSEVDTLNVWRYLVEKEISEDEKALKGIELTSGVTIEHFGDKFPVEEFFKFVAQHPEYFREDRMTEFGQIMENEPEKEKNIFAYMNGTENNDAKIEEAVSALKSIEKSIEPEISDREALYRAIEARIEQK